MTKKIVALILAILVLTGISTALADENLTATDQALILFNGKNTGYFFAKIENQGDSDIYVDYGSNLVIFDDKNEILLSEEYVTTMPAYIKLAPGEYTYCSEYLWDSALEGAIVSDYKFSPVSDTYGTDYPKLECEVTLDYAGADSYENYVCVTFTNTTGKTLYDYFVTGAVYDQNGALIYAGSNYSSTIGIAPDSTVTVRVYIDHDLAEYYAANNLVPTTADAMVYDQTSD